MSEKAKKSDAKKDEFQTVDVTPVTSTATNLQSPFMTDFFRKVDRLKKDMETLRKNINNIEKAHDEVLQSTTKIISTQNEERLHALMDETSNLMQKVKERLTDLQDDKAKTKKGDSEARIRENIRLVQSKKFIALSQEYQAMQVKYKDKYRDRVARQFRIVKPDAAQEEIDTLIKSDGAKDIFAKTLLQIRSDQAP